jgi:histidinol phosphatase-like PHP family hydrolase
MDREALMDDLVNRTVRRFDAHPIDIYAYPTRLPPSMRASADELWTETRMAKLIDALVRNKISVELNTAERLPSRKFILLAKDAGCKFAFGTANATAAELKRCEFGLQAVEDCKLDWRNFFAPGSWWPKAVERRWPSGV